MRVDVPTLRCDRCGAETQGRPMRARLVTPHADDDLEVDGFAVLSGGVLRLTLGRTVRLLAPGEWEDFIVERDDTVD